MFEMICQMNTQDCITAGNTESARRCLQTCRLHLKPRMMNGGAAAVASLARARVYGDHRTPSSPAVLCPASVACGTLAAGTSSSETPARVILP